MLRDFFYLNSHVHLLTAFLFINTFFIKKILNSQLAAAKNKPNKTSTIYINHVNALEALHKTSTIKWHEKKIHLCSCSKIIYSSLPLLSGSFINSNKTKSSQKYQTTICMFYVTQLRNNFDLVAQWLSILMC